jgi:DHA3 family macrolide efflux protein-like MFS transporter
MVGGKMKNWKSKTILFLISQCITLFGSTLVQMAIVWYVTIRSSSGTWIAAFTICSYVPQFLISFVGGVLADKYSKKILIIVSDAGIAIVTLVMMLLIPYISNNSVLLSSLLVMSVIRSFGSGIQTPAVNAVIPTLVPEEHLMRFNGINATMQSIVQFAAPAAAGVLLTFSSLQYSLLVDVITAAMGIGLLSAVAIPKCVVAADLSGKEQAVATAVEQDAVNEGDKINEGNRVNESVDVNKSHSAFDDMKDGLHYAFSNRIIGSLLIVYGLFIFLGVPAGFLSQLLVSRVYGNTYWYLTATELVGFAGMALGGIVMGVWGGFKSRVRTLLWGLSAFGLLACGMGLSKHFILYLCFMLIYGIALTMVQTATTTLIQEKAEEKMQGRVFGLLGTMYSGFLPIGMLLCGPLADRISLQVMMIVSGIALVLVALVMRSNKSFKD